MELNAVPWYLTRKIVFLGLAILGPLALPLVWLSPKFSLFQRLLWTLLTVLLTFFFLKFSIEMAGVLNQRMKEMKQMGLL